MERARQEDAPRLLYKVEEAAEMLSLSRAFLYRLIDRENVPVHRFGTSVRVSLDELKDWLQKRRVE